MYKELTHIQIPAQIDSIGPLQTYIKELALCSNISVEKAHDLEHLIEEIINGIIRHAMKKEKENKLEIIVKRGYDSIVLSFHYRGLPFGYNIECPEDEQDVISMEMIRGMSSSFSIHEDGKAGQTIEVQISAAPTEDLIKPASKTYDEHHLATDQTTIDYIRNEDMESLIQCLYYVFDYNYAADDMYNPDALRKKKAKGIYEGLVAKNSEGRIVAHVALLKNTPEDKICECGQAFVMPEYGKRGLFPQLKTELIRYADKVGMYGIVSNSITGHPFTQKANISLDCVETGLGLGYIPANVESIIRRIGEGKRQAVMNYFKTTSNKPKIKVFIPESHSEIIIETYNRLKLDRDITISSQGELPEGPSVISTNINNFWNHVYVTITHAGKEDFRRRIETILRRSAAAQCAVCYVSLPLEDEKTASVVAELENIGFFYSGITPYESNGTDSVKLQYIIINDNISKKDIIAESEWGNRLKDYIFNQMEMRVK